MRAGLLCPQTLRHQCVSVYETRAGSGFLSAVVVHGAPVSCGVRFLWLVQRSCWQPRVRQ